MKKAEKIQKMFSSIAHRYDKANNVLSFGVHHLWRKKLVGMSQAKKAQSILDCATGTGDLAIEFKRAAPANAYVLGTDFCKSMLNHAPQKAEKENLDIDFQVADVTELPFEKNRFDVVSISFGIRNVDNPAKAISEMARVCKPGGEVFVLEFGRPDSKILRAAYDSYSTKVLPKIGSAITGNKEAYEYLDESSGQFPHGNEFLEMMKAGSDFKELSMHSLSMGIAYIYKGVKA
jgi:demethylmenaquinone methyltransferase/2-methoxy-6-polyprenyl-1,4-benzoquinol methylase